MLGYLHDQPCVESCGSPLMLLCCRKLCHWGLWRESKRKLRLMWGVRASWCWTVVSGVGFAYDFSFSSQLFPTTTGSCVLLSIFLLSDLPGMLYGVTCEQTMGWLVLGWPAVLVIAKQVCIWWKWKNLRAIILLLISLFKFTVCAHLGYFCYGNLMKSSYRKIHASKCV